MPIKIPGTSGESEKTEGISVDSSIDFAKDGRTQFHSIITKKLFKKLPVVN